MPEAEQIADVSDSPHVEPDPSGSTGDDMEGPIGEDLSPQVVGRVEAVLMATDRPVPSARLSELLGGVGAKVIQQAIHHLNDVYRDTARSFRVEQVAGGWQFVTLPQYAPTLAALHKTRASTRLSTAAMETLAIVAYKQPVLRAQIETVRGVASGEVLRSLMERHLVKIVGRAEELGRPMLYGTTKAFLEVFGLANIKDLPRVEELVAKN